MVVVAYRKATIALADEVAYLEHGRILDRGTHAELTARNEGYRSLVDAYDHRGEAAERSGRRPPDEEGAGMSSTGAPTGSTTSRPIATTAARSGATDPPRPRALLRGSPGVGRITRGLALALVSTLGRVVVPLTVQQTVDGGIQAGGGPDVRRVAIFVAGAAVAVVITAAAAYVSNVRLFRSTEAGLVTLRVKAFRHIHDLSVLTQNAERRGSMVSRVTSDVDTISQFVQFGGLLLVLSIGQLLWPPS